ncbi:unnamed protein product [Thlaspi arvense]|uniref:Uncharacterized protein n=1 Tax=Thlaspi arvense TaxID=13288 RepID=A0AAU9SFH8_THLAR|nr:unnamed protein product [Thlaspi arvense]
METFHYQLPNTLHFFSPPSLSNPKAQKSSLIQFQYHPIHAPNTGNFRLRSFDGLLRPRAASGGMLAELERELKEEMKEGGKWRGKCSERGGIAEVMECLEREAIMGEDEGREPGDYNRRADIFEKSSRVFQALKESDELAGGAAPTNP